MPRAGDSGFARCTASGGEPDLDPVGQVGGPPDDRGERPGACQDRTRRHPQDRRELVPHPTGIRKWRIRGSLRHDLHRTRQASRFAISKWEVREAYRRANADKGAARVDGVSGDLFAPLDSNERKTLGALLDKIIQTASAGAAFPGHLAHGSLPHRKIARHRQAVEANMGAHSYWTALAYARWSAARIGPSPASW